MSGSRKLLRNPENRRLGGVCAGIAEYLGTDPTLVRILFLVSVFVSFGLTLWVYLVLWMLLPAKARLVRPRLSHGLSRRYRRLERAARVLADHGSPVIQERLQGVLVTVEALLPELEEKKLRRHPELEAIRVLALEHLPHLLESHARMLAAYHAGAAGDPETKLLTEVGRVETVLRGALQQISDRAYGREPGAPEPPAGLDAELQLRLDALERRAAGRLSGEALERLRQIRQEMAEILSRLPGELEGAQMEHTVRSTALRYLPEAVDGYLSLSPELARTRLLPNGKTAEATLLEQLDLMDQTLRQMLHSLHESDAQGLLVHGRFLREKFGEPPSGQSY